MDKHRNDEKKQGVMGSAVAMSMGTLASRVLGFIRDATIMAFYSRTATDAFVVAFKLPNFFRRVLGEGSLAVSFIPVYIEQLRPREGETPEQAHARAMQLTNALYTLLTTITLILCALCVVFMDWIILYWVGDQTGYASVPGKLEQTITLARIMFSYLYLVTLYAFMMAVANAHKRFFVPAVAPALFNLGMISVDILPASLSRVPGDLLAWGVIFGGVLQAGVVGWQLHKLGSLPRFRWNWQVSGLRQVLTNMVPGMLGLGIFQILTMVNVKFAARLPEGAQSYIYAADRLLELPQSLIAISLGTALLPAFSTLLADGKKDAMLKTANRYLRVQFFLSMPASIGLYVLALPIVQMLFMRGNFRQEDAEATASVVGVYCLLMIFSSGSKVIAPGFYAIKNTWLPAIVAAICVVIHVIVGSFWTEWYGLLGVVATTALTAFLNMSLLMLAFRKFVGPIGVWRVLLSILQQSPAMLAMGGLLYYGYPLLQSAVSSFLGNDSFARYITVPSAILVAIGLYFAVALACRCEEADEVYSLFKRRLRRAS